MSDKNDESDEGGSDFGGWTLQDVLAESGGVLKENLVTKPRPDFLWRLHVGGEKLVPLWGGAPQVLFGVEAGGEEELGSQLDGHQSRLFGLRGCQGNLEEKKKGNSNHVPTKHARRARSQVYRLVELLLKAFILESEEKS